MPTSHKWKLMVEIDEITVACLHHFKLFFGPFLSCKSISGIVGDYFLIPANFVQNIQSPKMLAEQV